MNLQITPAVEQPVVRIACPSCRERVKGVGFAQGSRVSGLTFKCKRCGKLWAVTDDKEKAESTRLSAGLR